MKKRATLARSLAVLALGTSTALAEEDADHCSLESLHGTFAYALVSASPLYTPVTPLVQQATSSSGEEYYDGRGHMKYTQLVNDGDHTYTYSGTGTYTITANCVATVTYEYQGSQSGSPWTYFVAPDGSSYYWNNNQNEGALSAGRVTRISRADLIP